MGPNYVLTTNVLAWRHTHPSTAEAFKAASSAVDRLMACLAIEDPRLTAKARQYRAAQKTAQSCSVVYQMRSVWDSNSTACDDWYQRPYGCAVRRNVPVDQCVPAYPSGVESPLETFVRLDESYRLAWAAKTTQAEATAAGKMEAKQATKDAAPMSFMLALQVFGGFLVVMFMFLLIAIERHMRRVASQRVAVASVPGA